MNVVARARRCVGARFRPQGRSIETGLDCVGLALFAWGLRPDAVQRDYRLRGGDESVLAAELARFGRPVELGEAGDIALARAGPGQPHLAVLVPGGFVHADLGSGRVEERPGAPTWPVLSNWRRG